MVVLTDVTTPSTDFELGRTTTEFDQLEIELDRVVPLGEDLLPYLWVQGDGQIEGFRRAIEETEAVDRCRRLEQVGSRTLFRLHWGSTTGELLPRFIENDATILEGRGRDPWFFRIRFPDRTALTDFYEGCRNAGLDIEVERVYSLQEAFEEETPGEVTEEQLEILELALKQGYYEVPRGVTLGELAGMVGISKQAASERLRRGMATVLQQTL